MENTRYAYWPIVDRPPLQWPNGARLALLVIPNIEHFRMGQHTAPGGSVPEIHYYAQRDYGNRVGVWRIAEALDRYGIRATVALNSEICRFEPQIIRAGNELRWEWMGHGRSNSERLHNFDEATERAIIRDVVDTIAEATGKAPRGWLAPGRQQSPRTPDLLAEAGFEYLTDWSADEQPFPMRVKQGRLIALQGSQISDMSAFEANRWPGEGFYQQIRDQFDELYEESERGGRVMSIALHPFLTGHPHRVRWFRKALEYVTGHDRVWLTTGSEVADWYFANYYDQALAQAPFPAAEP
jgi:peptidoglycan/xylan/chitin deacetylase (PgdA/CDA1 family)